jgi:hypothetical protein
MAIESVLSFMHKLFNIVKVKLTRYTPWRCMGAEEV